MLGSRRSPKVSDLNWSQSGEWLGTYNNAKIYQVHNIVQKIGYPTSSPDVRNPLELQKYYDPVNITNTEFFENTISISRFDTSREWSALGKPTDRDQWGMSVPTVNVRLQFQCLHKLLLTSSNTGLLQSSWE